MITPFTPTDVKNIIVSPMYDELISLINEGISNAAKNISLNAYKTDVKFHVTLIKQYPDFIVTQVLKQFKDSGWETWRTNTVLYLSHTYYTEALK